jgi:transposase
MTEPRHECEWQQKATAQEARIAQLESQVAVLTKALFGKKSEKLPRPSDELRERGDIAKPTREETRKKRAEIREWKDALPVERVVHPLPTNPETCKLCGGLPEHAMPPEVSSEYEKLQLKMIRLEHERQKARCKCGSHIVVAPPPPRVAEKTQYGPHLWAWTIAAHCLDSMPFYRLARSLGRQGVPISDAQLGAMFHRGAELLEPLYQRMQLLVAQEPVVLADETPIQVQAPGKTRRAYMWVFLAGTTVVYVYSPSRSGKTPSGVLGASVGVLVVDAYSGYNEVTRPDRRERAGCLAHLRRKCFDALPKAPEMREALDLILDVYAVEHEVKATGKVRSPVHRELRQTRSRDAMNRLKRWLDEHEPNWLPNEAAGKAVRYALDNWKEMTVFLDRVDVPVDNNESEAALRIVAKSRDSSLFVGNDDAGKRLAILLSLTRTAVACGINPEPYLADVLVRSQTWPNAHIDELLPWNWRAQSGGAGPPSDSLAADYKTE